MTKILDVDKIKIYLKKYHQKLTKNKTKQNKFKKNYRTDTKQNT